MQSSCAHPLRSPPPRSSLKRSSTTDPEGLTFDLIRFAPSGKYLATIAAPNPAPSHKQLVVYELQVRHMVVTWPSHGRYMVVTPQDKRESLVVTWPLQGRYMAVSW